MIEHMRRYGQQWLLNGTPAAAATKEARAA